MLFPIPIIVGTIRSGAKLLHLMLEAHFELAILLSSVQIGVWRHEMLSDELSEVETCPGELLSELEYLWVEM